LDLFSLSSGRKLRRLASVSVGRGLQLATPAAADDGRLFLTFTGEAVCAPKGTFAECPKFVPNSCRNIVTSLLPGQRTGRVAFTVAGSESIGEAVPNPAGNEMALSMTPCLSLHGTTGLFVRDLKTGLTRPVTTSANRCDGFGPAAWNRTGSEVVFPLDRANGRPIPMAGGIACPGGRSYLAVAPSPKGPRRGAVKLMKSDHACIFRAAAFDSVGVAAVEGCDRGDPQQGVGSYLGQAFLIQYGLEGRVIARIPLRLGLESAVVATEPSTGDVLITQDQPANEPYPERDWVWVFDGQRLRPVAHYRAFDAAQILAVPR
jgi:hypothetical protein